MIKCPTCQEVKEFQPWVDSENVFITADRQATCRQCGTVFDFHYGELPNTKAVKEAILEAVDQNVNHINRLKREFFWQEGHDEFRKFAIYFNICQFLKYGSPEPVNSDGLPPYVLTLQQPWAQLYAAGLKRLDTRPRATKARGTTLIHAAKKFDADQRAICKTEPFRTALESIGFADPDTLPLGAIVGAVDITKAVKVIDPSIARTYANELNLGLVMVPPEDPEFSFGDYTPNRYVWHGQNHRLLKEPIPYTNGQGYYLRYRNDLSTLKF